MKPWRPNNWDEIKRRVIAETLQKDMCEAIADALLEALKSRGLYGEYCEDFIVSSRVKPDDLDWAEAFFATLENKGTLVFIPGEEK